MQRWQYLIYNNANENLIYESVEIRKLFVLLYNVHKENMFPIEIEDEREAPLKPRLNKHG